MLTAIVNRSFAERHYGSESPLEQRFRMGQEGPWLTIVGVVLDVYVGGGNGGIGNDAVLADQFFTPLAQAPKFCSARCRHTAYRDRKTSARQMHRDGVSVKEIAKSLKADVTRVRGWLGKKKQR